VSAGPRRSADGFELTFAVNHLAPYLLTRLLLDSLRAAAPARVVTVSSAAHRRARDLDDLNAERRYWSVVAYAKSKAANILFASELARRLAGSGVTSNALHPGTVDTGLLRNAFAGLTRVPPLYGLVRPFVARPIDGARTSLFVAAAPELDGVTGEYFVGRRAMSPSRLARDASAARRLWEDSSRWTGLEG
jgi:NAD(P)-dependent dehydrogenase (short-subunit alcohol dehydrogenase family)